MAGEHIVLIGATSMVATDLHLQLVKAGHTVSALNSSIVNIIDKKSIYSILKQLQHIDYVINCAAFTNVDQCESLQKKAMSINAKGPLFLAKFCSEFNIPLIHLSTDYVFNGKSPVAYTETSVPSPINVYGKSKLKGEEHIQKYLNRYYIIRTQWVFGEHGKNFVQTIADQSKTTDSLSIVADQIGSPTSTLDIANAIISIIQKKPAYGIYNFRNENYCSWYELAQFIVNHLKRDITLLPVNTIESGRKAKRPSNSRLDISKYLKAQLHAPRSWQDAVIDYLDQ